MFNEGLLIGKRPFQDEAMPGKNYPFQGHTAKKFRRTTILQLNIEGLAASKINVLYCLALQSEPLVILQQETHYTDTDKSACSRDPKANEARGVPIELSTNSSALCPLRDPRGAYLCPRRVIN